MPWGEYALLLGRALRLRCPVCGQGRVFRTLFGMYERCPRCGWRYEREDGYFTGATAINLVISELVVVAAVIPLAINQAPLWLVILFGVTVPVLLPLLGFRHSRSLWMALDLALHPLAE
jgi:uncharacterized protein (DUF983 family)